MLTVYFLLLLIFCLKIGDIEGIKSQEKTIAYNSAPLTKQTNSNRTASSPYYLYFRQEPSDLNVYDFGYEVIDKDTANKQFREEHSHHDGAVEGSYGYLRPDGLISITTYKANGQQGYQSEVENFKMENTDHHKWLPSRKSWLKYRKHQNRSDAATQRLNVTKKQSKLMDTVADNPDRLPINFNTRMNTTSFVEMKDMKGVNMETTTTTTSTPSIIDILNNPIPLKINGGAQRNNVSGIAFEMVDNFIPQHFPLAPFELTPRMRNGEKTINQK